MGLLRTNTATRVTVGPFNGLDGITPATSLTVTSEKLTFLVDVSGVPTLVLDVAPTASGGANDMVHVSGDDAGWYDLELAAADVNYLGRARLSLNNVAAHCPVFHEFLIVPANVYDAFVLGTDKLTVDVAEWLGTAPATPATAGVPSVDAIAVGGAAPEDAADIAAAVRDVSNAAPASGSLGEDVATAAAGGGGGGLDAAGVRAALGMSAANMDTQLTGIDTNTDQIPAVKAKTDNLPSDPADQSLIIAATDAIMTRLGAPAGASTAADIAGVTTAVLAKLPSALVSGRMDASVGAMAANTITASALAADAVDEILDEQIGDGTVTLRQAMRVAIAALAGKISGAATTSVTIRNLADTANVVVATVDANGNRSAVTVVP